MNTSTILNRHFKYEMVEWGGRRVSLSQAGVVSSETTISLIVPSLSIAYLSESRPYFLASFVGGFAQALL